MLETRSGSARRRAPPTATASCASARPVTDPSCRCAWPRRRSTSYVDWVVESDVSPEHHRPRLSLDSAGRREQAAVDAGERRAQRVHPRATRWSRVEDRSLADQQSSSAAAGLPTGRTDRAGRQLQDALDAAALQTDQATAVVAQRLQTLDEPEIPCPRAAAAEGRVDDDPLRRASAHRCRWRLVVVSATLDRTIRVPNDITAKFGLDVLAVVPRHAALTAGRRWPRGRRSKPIKRGVRRPSTSSAGSPTAAWRSSTRTAAAST